MALGLEMRAGELEPSRRRGESSVGIGTEIVGQRKVDHRIATQSVGIDVGQVLGEQRLVGLEQFGFGESHRA